MIGKFRGAMSIHDNRHHLFLHKTPRPIPRRAFVVGQKFFDAVIIERGHVVSRVQTISYILVELTIAQRFNAGHYAFLFVESHWDDRDFLSSLAGLDLHFIPNPALKRWATLEPQARELVHIIASHLLALATERFFRSADRRGAGPRPGAVL